MDSTEPEVPANGDLPNPGSTGTPTPSYASYSAPAAVANGSLIKGTPERSSAGEIADPGSSYINGGIINNRFYSGSMTSESMDMSVNRESMSICARVSQHGAKLFTSKNVCAFQTAWSFSFKCYKW